MNFTSTSFEFDRNEQQWCTSARSSTESMSKKQRSDEILHTSIFDLLEDDYQVNDIVWAKFKGFSW